MVHSPLYPPMIKARLFVLGTERELLSTDLECYKTRNAKTGRPGPIPMGGLITLTFISSAGDDRLLYGLTHSPEGELCTLTTAKIVFYAGGLDGIVLFEYRLKDAAFVHWKEEFNAAGEAPMTVTLTISAAIQEIKGITWVKPWRESRVPPDKNVVHEKERQETASGDRGKKKDDGDKVEVVNTAPRANDVLGHIFRNASGHVNPETVASQDRYLGIFEKVAGNSKNLNPSILNPQAAKNGVQAFTQIFRNGQQVWVHTRNGRIFDAGINLIPK